MTPIIKRQDGAVALITAIIISLLLSIVLTGFIIVMVSEQRQATDSEQSVNAYYAAESGVEDAIGKIKGGLRTNQPCDGTITSKNVNLESTSPGAVGWNCQSITFSGQPSGRLQDPDAATQLDLSSASAFTSINLKWELSALNNNFTPPASGVIPSAAAWGATRPAAVELSVISYPKTATFLASAITTQNYLVLPGNIGPGSGSIAGGAGSNPLRGNCASGPAYKCSINLTGFITTGPAARSYVLRIRTRYKGTDYQMTAYNGAIVTNIPDGTATIDVTGKAGDVYRRVVYKVPFTKNVVKGLDYVLYSDTDICKDISIIGGAFTAAPGCGG